MEDKNGKLHPVMPSSIHDLLTLWRAEYAVFAEYRPLAVGIDVALRRPGVSNKLVRRALALHCKRLAYHAALARGGPRFALSGAPKPALDFPHVQRAGLNVPPGARRRRWRWGRDPYLQGMPARTILHLSKSGRAP